MRWRKKKNESEEVNKRPSSRQPKDNPLGGLAEVGFRRARASASHPTGTLQTWELLKGDPGSESLTGNTVNAYNDIDDIPSGTDGTLAKIAGQWWVMSFKC